MLYDKLEADKLKMPETILGYAEYNDKKYPFIYENGLLNLLPSNEKEWDKQKYELLRELAEISNFKVTHEWIPNVYIKGKTNDNKCVVFISKGECSNNNGFLQFEIQVIFEHELNALNGDLIHGFIINADEIDYFFPPYRVFESEVTFDDKKKIKDIKVKSGKDGSNTISCGNYLYNDISISVEVSAYSTYSTQLENPLSSQSQMCFEFNKAIDLNSALQIIYQQKNFLSYICYRKNITLRDINIFSRNENGLRKEEGKIYIISENTLIEKNKNRNKQILTLELLEQKIIPIFQAIADGKVYLAHLCNCIDDQKSYNVARIILIFAAFEREYNNFFPSKTIRSVQYLEVKEDVLSLLEDYKKNSCVNAKRRKYVEGFKKVINKSDSSLCERIKYSFNKYKDIMMPFLSYLYSNSDEDVTDKISERMNIMRNNIAHGNLDVNIEPIHILDFEMLEILIYVFRLNSLNLSQISIKKSICSLFGYNIYIPDN